MLKSRNSIQNIYQLAQFGHQLSTQYRVLSLGTDLALPMSASRGRPAQEVNWIQTVAREGCGETEPTRGFLDRRLDDKKKQNLEDDVCLCFERATLLLTQEIGAGWNTAIRCHRDCHALISQVVRTLHVASWWSGVDCNWIPELLRKMAVMACFKRIQKLKQGENAKFYRLNYFHM